MKKQGKEKCAAFPIGGGKGALDLPCPLLRLHAGLGEGPTTPSLAISCKKQALNANSWSKLLEKLKSNWTVVL